MRQLATFLVIFAAFYSVQAQGVQPTPDPNRCSLPPDEGTGTDVMIYLYYDKPNDKCLPFKYSGQGGNDNRFEAEVYCMRNCSAAAENLYPVNRQDACHFKKNAGECLGKYMRYYYDSVHQKCHSFFWTGCVGNGNRFLDMASCNSTCQGVTDPGDDPEEEEHDTPVGVILGVLLGIIGAIILVAVIVLAVKSKSSKSKKAPIDTSKPKAPLQEEDIEMRP